MPPPEQTLSEWAEKNYVPSSDPILLVQPSRADAETFSKERLAPQHRIFGTAFSPQGEDGYSWGTWWMGRAFDRAVEAARG